jgi:hypothetical protein
VAPGTGFEPVSPMDTDLAGLLPTRLGYPGTGSLLVQITHFNKFTLLPLDILTNTIGFNRDGEDESQDGGPRGTRTPDHRGVSAIS